ncbi:RUN domain-containing protein 1-like [Paramacrobiotus metropolitanus]|uniref:RUN domain-containing protein 1-like n=1 Tax=Paramacrobiotus metropolitanus TaxID=2943436 RepID=UPI002445BCA0|nr:RUN domain-containing protein 1-like [Paramacrobiotus metropolitanus]
MMEESASDEQGWADFTLASSHFDFASCPSPPSSAATRPTPDSCSGTSPVARSIPCSGAEWLAETESLSRSAPDSAPLSEGSGTGATWRWPGSRGSTELVDYAEEHPQPLSHTASLDRSLSASSERGNLMVFEQEQDVCSLADLDVRSDSEYLTRLTEMEQEQEMLNSSLMSLTTHFAQVQFRLKQISLADDMQAKEKLIKELELFAFEGCPDVRGMAPRRASIETTDEDHTQHYEQQAMETKELIQRLQRQLTDVEQWAYESGQSDAPSLAVLEKQRMILGTLQERVKLSLDGLEHLSPEEMRQKVDEAIESIISPYRKKELAQERTLTNLQTFVDDLERYIQHIHKAPSSSGSPGKPVPPSALTTVSLPRPVIRRETPGDAARERKNKTVTFNDPTAPGGLRRMASRTYSVLELMAWSNWTCWSQRRFHKNVMKTTSKGNHWGDARAALELAISQVLDLTQERAKLKVRRNGRAMQEAEKQVIEEQLHKAIRKDLTLALCALMQHGLAHVSNETSLVPRLVCVSRRPESTELHAWDFILKYFQYKKGEDFNRSATRRLADSFQLSSVGSRQINQPEALLASIADILHVHGKLQRTPLTLMKAFVCSALNQKTLAPWLRLMYCTQPLVEDFYTPWSYAMKTHFEDACQSLDNLSPFDFHLPVDLAVRPFHALSDAF